MRIPWILIVSLACPGAAFGQDDAPADNQFKTMSGMSILGNNEAPKSLVIVPWKSSEIGDGIGVASGLDDRPMPVDRDVFSRELNYYNIRSSGAPGPDRRGPDDVRVGSR